MFPASTSWAAKSNASSPATRFSALQAGSSACGAFSEENFFLGMALGPGRIAFLINNAGLAFKCHIPEASDKHGIHSQGELFILGHRLKAAPEPVLLLPVVPGTVVGGRLHKDVCPQTGQAFPDLCMERIQADGYA